MRSRMLWVAAFAGLVAMMLPAVTLGQTQNGELNGRVRDPDGLPLPGVTITLTEVATGYSRTTVSTGDGAYVIPNLRPRTYDINVEMQGFKTINQTGLIVSSGAELTVNYDLELATIEEVVTVTAETPLVEVTSNRIGGTLATKEIDEIPANFRNFTALTQLIPGMTPNPSQSTFEGGGASANGAVGANNLFMIDGGYNNDDQRGSGPGAQVRVVLDVIGEYQVLASQYAAEYSGAAGAILNMVTRSGTNDFSGRGYAYYRNDSMYARSEFLDPDEPKPEEKTLQAGFGIGGPIVQDKAHFYFNYERDNEDIGGFKDLPDEGQPIAQDFVGFFNVGADNYFGRVDVQLNPNHILTGRWVLENAPALGEGFNTNTQTADARRFEGDHDQNINLSLTSILGDRASNSFRFTTIDEKLRSGSQTYFTPDVEFLGLDGRSQFSIGASQVHPGYTAGTGGTGADNRVRTYDFADSFSYFLPDKMGDHNLKFGAGFSRNRTPPSVQVHSGTFEFESDLPFDPANRETYPVEYEISLIPPGTEGFELFANDWRAHFFVQDKWRYNDQLTFNLGLRWDYQDIVPNSGDDFAPRLGVAYDPKGDGKTVIRAGFGRFSLWTLNGVPVELLRRALVSPFPTLTVADSDSAVLNPDLGTDSEGNPGIAVVSAAGEAELNAERDRILAGSVYNTEPRFDSDRRAMPYQWGWSIGFQRELAQDWALTADYVANVSRDQTGLIDINEPVNGVRPGVDVFDPNGELVPFGEGRDTAFRRVLQYQTRDELNGDYKSLQIGVNKRFSNRFSMRHAYTLQRSNYVGSGTQRQVWLDNDIRADYGRGPLDRKHVLSMSGTYNPVGGLTLGGILSASSGPPANETTGGDGNKDNDRTDRPIAGIDDKVIPIESELDSQGRAVIRGIDGPGYFELNLSVRYTFDLGGNRSVGLFWDLFNLTNRTNLDGINSTRSSASFLQSQNALLPRQMQIGARFSF